AGVQVHRRQQHRSGQGRPHARWHHHFHQCRYHPGGLARLERRQGGRDPQILEEAGAEEMKTVPAEEFSLWAAEKGIRVDETKLLSMPVPREYARFWVLPHDPTSWPFFTLGQAGSTRYSAFATRTCQGRGRKLGTGRDLACQPGRKICSCPWRSIAR